MITLHSKRRAIWGMGLLMGTLCLLGSACQPERKAGNGPLPAGDAAPGQDWSVVPGVRVGPVDSTTSEHALIERIGAQHVVRRDAHIGEGFCAPGSVIYPGTVDSVVVIWADTTLTRPAAAMVSGMDSHWRTPKGVHVGMALKELESQNFGKPIRLLGFGWDYGGTGSWSEGSGQMAIVLHPDSASYASASSDPRAREIMGDHEVSSDHPLIRQMNVRLERMIVRWGEPTVQYPCPGL